MRIVVKRLSIYILFILSALSCISPFKADIKGAGGGTLVVEGDIVYNGFSKFYLRKTIALGESAVSSERIYVTGVWIEDQSGNMWLATEERENSNDYYYLVNTTEIQMNEKYKLCITLPDGRVYESEFVEVLSTPDIDSVYYSVNSADKRVDFFVDTHDPDGKSNYYKWTYDEDWEFRVAYYTSEYFDPYSNKIVSYSGSENTYYCWKSGVSSNISIAKAANVVNKAVQGNYLANIGSEEYRTEYLYSMNVKQITLSEEAYKYWDNLKKQSYELGGLFSPQPSEMIGNIKCISHPEEAVFGFISASECRTKRIFVEMEKYRLFDHNFCYTESIYPELTQMDFYNMGMRYVGGGLWTPRKCVDCRATGTKVKPDFWPNNHK